MFCQRGCVLVVEPNAAVPLGRARGAAHSVSHVPPLSTNHVITLVWQNANRGTLEACAPLTAVSDEGVELGAVSVSPEG
jgi:hypothetical protein